MLLPRFNEQLLPISNLCQELLQCHSSRVNRLTNKEFHICYKFAPAPDFGRKCACWLSYTRLTVSGGACGRFPLLRRAGEQQLSFRGSSHHAACSPLFRPATPGWPQCTLAAHHRFRSIMHCMDSKMEAASNSACDATVMACIRKWQWITICGQFRHRWTNSQVPEGSVSDECCTS